MSNPIHVSLIQSGVDNWNRWRQENPFVAPDLSQAELQGLNLYEADLHETDLSDVRLMGADLTRAKLHNSNLDRVHINDARAWYADFRDCKMRGAYLWGTDFREANFSRADLTGANLRNTHLVMTKFHETTLTGCKIYGIAAWDIELDLAKQSDLIISAPNQPNTITVDSLEVAQFIYLLLNNERIRRVIDTITSKVVLILGRFTPDRKSILDTIREELRRHNYVPILFDFEVPRHRDITETVTLLARMARFIVADLTEASSISHELEAFVPNLAVPVQPLLTGAQLPYSMFKDHWKYDWVLPIFRYEDREGLVSSLATKVIAPAESKILDLRQRRPPIP